MKGVGKPIVPREHGAWAVLYGAFLAGTGVAGAPGLPTLLLLLGITALAFANGPLAVLSRGVAGARRRQAAAWLLVYALVAGAALVPLVAVFRMHFLVPFAAAAAAFLGLRLFLLRGRDERSLPAELSGVAALSMGGPVAHAVTLGRFEPAGLLLWLLLALFFASGIFYVRMRIQEMLARRTGRARSAAFRPCLAYHLALLLLVPALVVARLVPAAVLLAFAPALWRAAAGLRARHAPLDVKRLGWSETRLTLAFILLLVGTFWLARLTT
ncbi:MAG: YwiC-like family protein [Candidatus Methylomirabilales bacterium]